MFSFYGNIICEIALTTIITPAPTEQPMNKIA